MHDGGVDHHVVVEKLGGPRRIGENPADRAGDQEDILGAVRPEPVVHGRLISEIELLARRRQQVGETVAAQPPQDCRTDKSAVAGNEYSRGWVH